jgi:hypothetical protein
MTRARPAPEAVPPKKSVPRAHRSGSKVRPDPNPRLAAKAPEDSVGPFERAQREAETIRWAALRRRFRNGALGTAAAHGFRSAENEREFSIDIGSYDDDRSGRKRGGAGRGPRIVGAHDVAARLMLAAAIDGCEGLAGELRSGAPVFDVADRFELEAVEVCWTDVIFGEDAEKTSSVAAKTGVERHASTARPSPPSSLPARACRRHRSSFDEHRKGFDMTKARSVPPLPPARRKTGASQYLARRNDVLRRGVLQALRGSGRYAVVANARVPISDAARAAVRRANGSYLSASLPVDGARETVTVDLVVDEANGWAGAFAFCGHGAQSTLARRKIEDDLRAAELLLRAHLTASLAVPIETVTVGIIDGSADPEESDDITIAASEIADRFDISFPATESFDPPRRLIADPGRPASRSDRQTNP